MSNLPTLKVKGQLYRVADSIMTKDINYPVLSIDVQKRTAVIGVPKKVKGGRFKLDPHHLDLSTVKEAHPVFMRDFNSPAWSSGYYIAKTDDGHLVSLTLEGTPDTWDEVIPHDRKLIEK